ncbi:TIGR03790 family protein [Gemmatimonas sp.]|uniref:TIGR03790 family protein n=1 Tax=Gemmatimonas sp. TaxID=1962908 RepID=UPI003564D8A5
MTFRTLALLGGTLCLGACAAPAPRVEKRAPATGAERVLVVINTRSSASDSVGRYYAKRRGIDPTHIVRLELPLDDEIGDIAFQTDIVLPVRAAIAALPVRIDFIVLTTDVPIRVARKSGSSVDAMLGAMNLAIPPMVGLDSVWLSRYRNPYYNADGPFASDRYGMYLVTRLDCARVTDCLALVDRSIAARPAPGPFFFDAMPPRRGTDGYATMNLLLYRAAYRLPQRGVGVQIDTTEAFVAPTGPVMGYVSWGSNDSRFDSVAYHAVRFLPGALAETFVSTSARTFRPVNGGQSRIVDLISQGVTGVKGYVSEPFTLALANPDILFDRYVRGANLAEAFYAASYMVLWKDLVIGDPLCAPYALFQEPSFAP